MLLKDGYDPAMTKAVAELLLQLLSYIPQSEYVGFMVDGVNWGSFYTRSSAIPVSIIVPILCIHSSFYDRGVYNSTK
jgi:hypothetical protein